jgi:hypothetical protein
MSQVSSARQQIQEALSRLMQQWQHASERWRDHNQASFGKQFIDQYQPTISPALKSMDYLDNTIEQARSQVR